MLMVLEINGHNLEMDFNVTSTSMYQICLTPGKRKFSYVVSFILKILPSLL